MDYYFDQRSCCPVCRGTDDKLLVSLPYSDPRLIGYLRNFYSHHYLDDINYLNNAQYQLIKCNLCKFIYQREVPKPELLNRIYEKWINSEVAKELHYEHRRFRSVILSEEMYQIYSLFTDNVSREIKILDFGMGWGEFAIMAKAFGADVYGTDLSETRMQYGAKHFKVIRDLETADNDFDFINTEQVFEHLVDPMEVLTLLMSRLQRGAYLKISVPTALNIGARIKHFDLKSDKKSLYSINPVAPLEHLNFFTRKTFSVMASKVGAEVCTVPVMDQLSSMHFQIRKPKIFFGQLVKPFYRKFFSNYVFLKKI